MALINKLIKIIHIKCVLVFKKFGLVTVHKGFLQSGEMVPGESCDLKAFHNGVAIRANTHPPYYNLKKRR